MEGVFFDKMKIRSYNQRNGPPRSKISSAGVWRQKMRRTALCLILLLGVSWGAEAYRQQPVSVHFAPHVPPSSKMTNAVVFVQIERNDNNLQIDLTCSSEDMEASSSQQLDGSRGYPPQIKFEFNLLRGQNWCQATLIRKKGGSTQTFQDKTSFYL